MNLNPPAHVILESPQSQLDLDFRLGLGLGQLDLGLGLDNFMLRFNLHLDVGCPYHGHAVIVTFVLMGKITNPFLHLASAQGRPF